MQCAADRSRSNFDETSEAPVPDVGLCLCQRRGGRGHLQGREQRTINIRASAIRPSACSRTGWPLSKVPRLVVPLRPACRRCSSRCWRCSSPATGSWPRASSSAPVTISSPICCRSTACRASWSMVAISRSGRRRSASPRRRCSSRSPSNPMLDIVDVQGGVRSRAQGGRQGRARQCLCHADPAAAA